MELLVFGHAGAKVLIFPTRGGRFYEYENLGLVGSLRHKIEAGQIQLYCVDTVDSESFYCFWAHPSGRIERHIAYEDYVLHEVMPLMEQKNNHPCTISHGCSLGAFLAANIAFRHPYLFKKLVAFSGRYDLTTPVECFDDLFDGYYSETIYYHTPAHFLKNLRHEEKLKDLRNLEVILTIGKTDPFIENNQDLCGILREKGIPHEIHYWEGRAHRGRYWRQMAPIFI
jgi:esterase/lipase superfamily enzyme